MSSGTIAGRSGDKWKKTRHDQYYFLAKEQGYRSRAAFKLIQMNKKFNFLDKCNAVLDLGAAPGSWLQVCQKHMPQGSTIIGVDLLPIRAIPNVKMLKHDITTEICKNAIKKELKDGMVDLVLHDGAPNVAGGQAWAKDAYQQIELVLHSLKLTTHFLRQGGNFVSKVFRSQDYNALLWVMKQFFKQTTISKPAASRNASAEIFIVCQGYLAPKKIDPKLLNPAFIFSNPENGALQKVDVFHDKPGKRNREGYADGVGSLLFTQASVADFIENDTPVDMLGQFNSFEFDAASEIYLNHVSTNEEVKELCRDLKVLGKGDFSYLLKWRKRLQAWKKDMEKEAQREEKEEEAEAAPELTAEEQAELEEERLGEQMELLTKKQAREKKLDKKKRLERLNKERKRKELNANTVEAEAEEEDGLFALQAIRDGAQLDEVHDNGAQGLALEHDALKEGDWSGDSQDEGSESEGTRQGRMEGDLDAAYVQYKERRKIYTKKKTKLTLDGEDDSASSDEAGSGGDEGDAEDGSEEEEEEEAENNPLLKYKQAPAQASKKEMLSKWFDRDSFQNMEGGANDKVKAAPGKQTGGFDDEEASSSSEDGEGMGMVEQDDEEEEEEEEERPQKKAKKDAKKEAKKEAKAKRESAGKSKGGIAAAIDASQKAEAGKNKASTKGDGSDSDFEEVPLSDYSSDSEAMAETLALGTMMLRKKKKIDIINGGYNRYAYDDEALLPDWFRDEEMQHNKGSIPVTKEMVEAFKLKEKAINSRSIKKVRNSLKA
jgi:AdoMet-dependent rRNA methyltransferase SPB1